MAGGPERVFYIKTLLAMYLVWAAVFTCVGRAAALLPATDLTSSIDRAIPLLPSFVWPYFLGYFYPLLLVVAVRDGTRFNRVIAAAVLANLAAYAVYFLWPVTCAEPELGLSLPERMLAAHNAIDFRPGACKLPSLHVVFVWLTFLGCRRQRWGAPGDVAMALAAAVISVSTVLVKKHIAVDVLAGVVWALAAWAVAGRLLKRLGEGAASPPEALRRAFRRGAPAVAAGLVLLALVFGVRWILTRGA